VNNAILQICSYTRARVNWQGGEGNAQLWGWTKLGAAASQQVSVTSLSRLLGRRGTAVAPSSLRYPVDPHTASELRCRLPDCNIRLANHCCLHTNWTLAIATTRSSRRARDTTPVLAINTRPCLRPASQSRSSNSPYTHSHC